MASDIVLQPVDLDIRKQDKSDKSELTAIPMILEVNAQPGLKIQIVNRAGLRERLARVRGLKVVSVKHGIRIAQALFADPRLESKELGRKVIGVFEEVEIRGLNWTQEIVKAKIDTGAYSSSLDRGVAEKLGLLEEDNVLYQDYFESALGRKKRSIVGIIFKLGEKKLKTRVSISDRSKLRYQMIIGRRDLADFVVRVGQRDLKPE